MAGESTVAGLAESLHKGAVGMERMNKASEGVALSMGQIVRGALTYQAINQVMHSIVQNSNTWKSISQSISSEGLNRLTRLKREDEARKRHEILSRSVAELDEASSLIAKEEIAHLEGQLSIIEKQKVLSHAMLKMGNVRMAILGSEIALLASTYRNASAFNTSLVQANSSYRHRNVILRESLNIQAKLGSNFGDVSNAAAALVSYGLDTKKNFGDNLRIVMQMHTALGVSVSESAQLAAVVENRLHASFSGVSDVIADIVDNTSLAGDEATRLAHTISMAMSRLGPGMSAVGLPDVIRLAGRYEGALKEVGGSAGDLGQLINQLTSAQGLVSQGMLGISPDMLQSKEGFQIAMDRFAKLGNSMVNSQNSQQRLQQLQIFAEQFGLSVDQANSLLRVTKHLNREQGAQVSLGERWANQMRAANMGISRLSNTFISLLQQAILPVVPVISWIANTLADLLATISQYRRVVDAIAVGLVVGAVALGPARWCVAKAMWDVVVASVVVSRRRRAQALEQGLGGMGGLGARGLFAAGALPTLAGGAVALAVASAWATVITAPIILLSISLKKSAEATLEHTKLLAQAARERAGAVKHGMTSAIDQTFNAVRYGKNADLAAIIQKTTDDYMLQRGKAKSVGEMAGLDRTYQENVKKLQSTAAWALNSKHVLSQRTEASDAADAKTQELIAAATKKAADVAVANIQEDRERFAEQQAQWAKERATREATRAAIDAAPQIYKRSF